MPTKQSTTRGASRKPARKIAAKKAPAKPARRTVATPQPPALGEVWKGQGGIYLGIIRGEVGQQDAHLIAAINGPAALKGSWGVEKKLSGAMHHYDGMANTLAMAGAGSAIAKTALLVKIDGHQDFHIPARDEARLAYINGREHFEKQGWYWTSTQDESYDAYAWVQDFEYGYQLNYHKSDERRVFLVRRVPIQ